MSLVWVVLGLVAAQRLGELVLSRRNERRLLDRGAREVGAAHYPFLVLLHATWLLAMALTISPAASIHVPLLVVFLILQGFRVWIISSLGPFWTTRVITLPGAPLVRRGPYRFLNHPNYVVVTAEIAVLPLVFGAWEIAALFSLLNGIVLAYRIRIENAALRERRDITASA